MVDACEEHRALGDCTTLFVLTILHLMLESTKAHFFLSFTLLLKLRLKSLCAEQILLMHNEREVCI